MTKYSVLGALPTHGVEFKRGKSMNQGLVDTGVRPHFAQRAMISTCAPPHEPAASRGAVMHAHLWAFAFRRNGPAVLDLRQRWTSPQRRRGGYGATFSFKKQKQNLGDVDVGQLPRWKRGSDEQARGRQRAQAFYRTRFLLVGGSRLWRAEGGGVRRSRYLVPSRPPLLSFANG